MTAEPPGPPVRKWGNRIETGKKVSKVSLRRVLGSLPLSPDLLTVPLASQVRKLGSREEN